MARTEPTDSDGPGRVELRGRTRREDGARLAHQVSGPFDAPALLLLAGQVNSHRWWNAVRPRLAQTFFTITLDYRGTGDTEAPEGSDVPPWSTASFADDAAAVLRSLGRSEAFVYGTSLGGRVAQELVLRHPDLVRRLVLACTSPGGRHSHERDNSVGRALSDPDPAARLRTSVDLFYTPEFTRAHGGVEGVPRHLFGDSRMSTEASRRHLRVSAAHDAYDRLERIEAPTLVLHGDSDLMVPTGNAEILGERLRHGEVEFVPQGRHGFFEEFADTVTPRVTEFLGKN